MVVTCENCHAVLRCEGAYRKKGAVKARCPQCKHVFEISASENPFDDGDFLFSPSWSEAAEAFLRRCVLVDLEVAGQNRIYHIGAVFRDHTFERKGSFRIETALQELDRFCEGADFVLGHNILSHDLPVIDSFGVDLRFTRLPVVDTLYLSPLAFPENPYHRLVKDYKLVSDSLNDPVSDARLAGSVFLDQWESFSRLSENGRDILSFYRFCFDDANLAGLQPGKAWPISFAGWVPKIRLPNKRPQHYFRRTPRTGSAPTSLKKSSRRIWRRPGTVRRSLTHWHGCGWPAEIPWFRPG